MSLDEKAELYSRLSKIDSNMSRVLFILDNDRNTNQHGLVEAVKILEKKVEQLEMEKKMFVAKAGVYATIGSALAIVMGWIIKQVAGIVI